ncbi:MAG: glycine cleavage system protein R [Gammaproteobacteria bacterium]|nr:glycine cleavage system protein R [Gammaproteobacteria bacterium]
MKQQLLVITCVGSDRPGLVDQLTRVILDSKGNLVDSRMTVLGEDFAILTLVSGSWDTIAKLEDSLASMGEKENLTITTRRTEERQAKADAVPYGVDAVSVDSPGIVHNLAEFFAARNINIEELNTNRYAAPHTGTPMFAVHMAIAVPANLHLNTLREEFFSFCDEINLDAVLEPVKG